MNMIDIKFNGDLATVQIDTGNLGRDTVLTPQKIPLLVLRIVESGFKDEQLNIIQMY